VIPKPPNSNELEEEYNLEKCIMRRGYRRLHIVFFSGTVGAFYLLFEGAIIGAVTGGFVGLIVKLAMKLAAASDFRNLID